MVRTAVTCSSAARRCPRLRGDGPEMARGAERPARVSPPTRGWSRHACPPASGRPGVPAYAGMVRRANAAKLRKARCPRLRGDGPLISAREPMPRAVSPPTRGWSHQVGSRRLRPRGVPAYAGMVPLADLAGWSSLRCPRLRGDGPRVLLGSGLVGVVSPPTRGWSRQGE